MAFVAAFILFGIRQSLRGPFYGLLFYLALAYFRPESWVYIGQSQLQSLNLSFLVGLFVVAGTLLSPTERIKWDVPVILIVLLCVHGLISTLISNNVAWSWFWWKGFAKVTLVTILIISLVNSEERFRTALIVIALALGFDSIKQGWVFIVLRQSEANLNSVEILGDNNGVAVGMLMLSAVLLALLQTSSKIVHKGAYAFMAIGSFARALATFSRGGLLSLGAMTVVYWTRTKHRLAMGALIVVVAGGLLQMMPQGFWARMDTITTDENQMEKSSAGRLYFWRLAVRMANDHPFFGVGTSAFQMNYDAYDETDEAYGRQRAVHSTWFGMLAEQGYVGLSMLIAIIVLALVAAGRARRLTRKLPDRVATFTYAGAMQTALVTAVVGGSFLSYHYVEILWHFIGLSFAIGRIAQAQAAEKVEQTAAVAKQPAVAGRFAPALGYRMQGR